ncbi:MAG: PIN domain-containing protein [Thermoleophilia bacterium]
MLVALVDTGVVVSGVLSGDTESATVRILDAMLAGTLRFVLSEALLAEYRQVLLRPSIRERHRLTEREVDAILEDVVVNSGFRESPPLGEVAMMAQGRSAPVMGGALVPGDEHVLALLAVAPEAALVTCDRRLRVAVAPWREALTPAEFLARSQGG